MLWFLLVAVFSISTCSARWTQPAIQQYELTKAIQNDESVIRRQYKDVGETNDNEKDASKQNSLRAQKLVLDRLMQPNFILNRTIYAFNYLNCDWATDVVAISKFAIDPNPFMIPGEAKVTIDFHVAVEISKATHINVVVKKRFWMFDVIVPCINNFGSCVYTNPCDMLLSVPCPEEFIKRGWECTCPFKEGRFTLQNKEIYIPNVSIPINLKCGDYKFEIELMTGDSRLGCIKFDVSID